MEFNFARQLDRVYCGWNWFYEQLFRNNMVGESQSDGKTSPGIRPITELASTIWNGALVQDNTTQEYTTSDMDLKLSRL